MITKATYWEPARHEKDKWHLRGNRLDFNGRILNNRYHLASYWRENGNFVWQVLVPDNGTVTKQGSCASAAAAQENIQQTIRQIAGQERKKPLPRVAF